MLDRKPITIAERVQAFLRYAVAGGPRARDIAAGLFRWKLVLMSQFGQAAVNTLFGNTPVATTDAAAASSKDEISVDSRLSLSHRSLVGGSKEDGLGGWTASMVLRAPQNLAGPLSRLRSLVVQGMALSVVDVRGMIALEIIDLRNNNLEVCTPAASVLVIACGLMCLQLCCCRALASLV
jgi:hypothetical protein